jgi:hypothetical protein
VYVRPGALYTAVLHVQRLYFVSGQSITTQRYGKEQKGNNVESNRALPHLLQRDGFGWSHKGKRYVFTLAPNNAL